MATLNIGIITTLNMQGDLIHIQIGLQGAESELFRNIGWGQDQVLAATLNRADALGIELTRLKTLRDLDDISDLQEIANTLPILNQWVGKK